MSKRPPTRYEDLGVAIICTKQEQFLAVMLLFDEFFHLDWDGNRKSDRKDIRIGTGRIGEHSVALALLRRVGKAGRVPEANIWSWFTSLELVILAGSCGGVPFIDNGQDDVLLGDVIINDLPVHYKFMENGAFVESRQRLRGPKQQSENFRKFSKIFQTSSGRNDLANKTAYFLSELRDAGVYVYPGPAEDKLFKSSYHHKHHSSATCICNNHRGTNYSVCEEALDSSCNSLGCDEKYLVVRKLEDVKAREEQKPVIHFGRIASLDTMMKSGEDRDRFAEAERIIAFETEGIWRWEGLPCLMVKGVCDYADGHRNCDNGRSPTWELYAAATAASAIKALLEHYPQTNTDRGRHVKGGHLLVPMERNPNFGGREAILSKLLLKILLKLLLKIKPYAKKDDCYRAVVVGHEGVGKTQIALEAVYRLHDKHTGCSIYWVSATDAKSFENGYYCIGKKLKVEGIDEDEADVKLLVKAAMNDESSGTWLLVIDDADTLELFGLSDYLPSNPNGSIIFVLQNVETVVSLYIPKESIFRVEEMNCDEALELLHNGLKEAYKRETSDMNRLFNFLDELASSYTRQGRWAAAEKLEVRLMEAGRMIFGDEDHNTLAIMDNLVQRYQYRRQWEDAEILELRIIESRKRSLGDDNERTLASIRTLAFIYANQGRQGDAKKLEVQILEVRKTRLARLEQHIPLKEDSKDSERDSGYGPASRRATTAVPLVSDLHSDVKAINAIISSEKSDVEIDMLAEPDDDIRSVVSEGDDLKSQITNFTDEEMTGEALVRLFLFEQPQFKAFCEKALAITNRWRFVKNLTRLLKSYHIWLAEEAKSEAEKVVTELIRSKRGRQRISEQLAAHIDMENEETQGFDKGDLPYGFIFIPELRRFLLASKAFQNLQVQFALMFLSTDLGHMLQSIPKESIWLSQEQDVSISNRFKALVENSTQVRWNWWPLSQRKRMLNPGESRLFWKCTCGIKQWEQVSPEQLKFVERILECSDNCPTLASRCGARKTQATLFSSIKGILQYVGEQITRPSRAATRYTPQESSSSTPPESVQLQLLAGAAPLRQQQGSTIGQQAQVAILDSNNSLQWWILFGVRGAQRTLVPAQIHVTSQTTDSHVFQELKRCYMIYRGRLRLWLSVWRLDYCEVVKFSRLTPDRMVREYRELPSDKDYHYDPRAGERDVRNPPISPHHFQTLFYACPSPCTWPFPHDCIPLVANTVNLARIPKRTREFEKDQSSPIWGFETVFAVSFSYVLAYHVVMVAGPFIFWGLWMKFHPDDLQNASVPITVVIGSLSLFWSGAGILTSRERE